MRLTQSWGSDVREAAGPAMDAAASSSYPAAWTLCGYRGRGDAIWLKSGRFDPAIALIDEGRGVAITKIKTAGSVETMEVKAR